MPHFSLFAALSLSLEAHCVELNEGRPILSAAKMLLIVSSFWDIKIDGGFYWFFEIQGFKQQYGTQKPRLMDCSTAVPFPLRQLSFLVENY